MCVEFMIINIYIHQNYYIICSSNVASSKRLSAMTNPFFFLKIANIRAEFKIHTPLTCQMLVLTTFICFSLCGSKVLC